MNSDKQKEVYRNELSIPVNDETAVMNYKLDCNTGNGNVKMTFVMTTRHISFNDDLEKAVLEQFRKLGGMAYDDAKSFRKSWLESQSEIPGQPKLPFEESTDDGVKAEAAVDDDIQPKEEPKPKTRRRRTPSTPKVVAK